METLNHLAEHGQGADMFIGGRGFDSPHLSTNNERKIKWHSPL